MSGRHRRSHRRGRHRRHLLGARSAAVAGAGASVGLAILAPPASADTYSGVPDRWSDLVACESGGNPHVVNPTSGAAGLFQILESTWDGHGGEQFADTADLATPAEQLVVAERVLASQGPGAWVCPGAPSSPMSVRAPASPSPDVSTGDSGDAASHAGLSERAVDIRQGYDGTCDPADLYWDSCDPADLGTGHAQGSPGDKPVLYYRAGVAIKDLDGDGDGDPVRCGPPALLSYERCD